MRMDAWLDSESQGSSSRSSPRPCPRLAESPQSSPAQPRPRTGHFHCGEICETLGFTTQCSTLIGPGPSRLCSDWLRSWCCYASSSCPLLWFYLYGIKESWRHQHLGPDLRLLVDLSGFTIRRLSVTSVWSGGSHICPPVVLSS